jgi:hypothetical protein
VSRETTPEPQKAAAVVPRALLGTSVAVLAGIAAIVSPPAWPLAAGLLPVAVMAMNLPARG